MKRFILSVLLAVFAGVATAQEATIVGTITDPTGAPVPNVAVTITNTDTGVARKTASNGVGQYTVPDLHIGGYKLRAEAAGFKASEQAGITLSVGERSRVDIKLELGSTQESVNVEATAVQVQTDSGEISDVITGQQVTQLATNGRSIYSLALLTAGASGNMSDFQQPTPVGGDASISFNGMRQNHNLWTIDGGEASDRGGAGGLDVMPSIDSIAEFRVLTSNYSAEYGLSSAATMTMVVKGGTKDFHAGAWEFLRNDALNANDFFFNRAGKTTPPELRFNTYGFNAGGPVMFPKVGFNKNKDRTFFFYNMEWRKLIQGGNVNTTVPLPGTYGGAFPSSTIIKVPTADQLSPSVLSKFTGLGLVPGQPFPNNTIPATLLDPNAQALLKAGIFPGPTSGSKFVGGNKLPTDVREEIVRIDHRFSDKFWIFGHYISEQISQTYGTSLWSGDNVPSVGTVFGNPAYHGVIRATYSISPTLLNEVAYNQNGNVINIVPNGLYARPSGFNVPELFAGNNLNRIPSINLSGSTGTNYDIASWPWHNKADDYQIRDDLSWTRGSHQFKMGGSWALYKKTQDLFGNTQGNFSFNGQYTGNDFADYLLGLSNSYTELALQDHGQWNNASWAAYIQDNWRVNSRLTLNLGLRWDGIPHTYEASNRGSNFYPNLYDPSKKAVILPDGTISPNSPGLGTSSNPVLSGLQFYLNGIGIAGQNGISNGLTKNYWDTFGPRLGLAYDLTGKGKTILRGGFGVMYERIQGNDMYNGGPNVPFSSSVTFNNVSLSNPKTSLLTGGTLSAPITVASITGIANDYKIPTSYQWSLGIQHELWRESVVSVSYVGNANPHQTYYRENNLPSPSVLPSLINGTVSYNTVVPYLGYHSINLLEVGENSHYNSLQVNFRGRIRNNLTLQVAYTLSKSVDPAGGDLSGISNPYDRSYDNGPGVYDRTHIGLVNFIYKLPFFENTSNRMTKALLGGWELSGIITMQTGLPLYITQGGSQGSNGLANGTNRPNYSGNISYPKSVDQWFSTSSFSAPAVGAWGTAPRGVGRGPGRDNWNTSLFKSFVFNERGSRVEFRAESFNTWNHTQFRNVSTTFTASDFGQVTSVWDPRVFQLGLKVLF
jgi:Carboxypeptidase regulatory-like domain/TonB-dependent Receptor Plug Domain